MATTQTSDDIRETLKSQLVRRAVIQPAEGLAATLDDIFTTALSQFDPSTEGNFTALTPIEYEAVILLAWIEVCMTRASTMAPQPSLALRNNAPGFGADRDTPFKKCMDLAKKLEERYHAYCERHGIGEYEEDGGDVTVGSLYRDDERSSGKLPVTDAPALPIPTLTATPETGAVLIEWNLGSPDTLAEAMLFVCTNSAIYQPWNQNSTTGIPRLNNLASITYRTTDIGEKAVRCTTTSGTYYFLLVLRDTNGNLTYSAPVTAVVP